MSTLKGKVAVVTGASKGIGAATAKALAEAGASVVMNYASSKDGADRVVADIKAKGGDAIAVQGNVAKSADVVKLFDETRKKYGRLDVLVNNAGIYNFLPIEKLDETEFHRQFDTNVLGALLATREAVKLFGNNGGNVINITSVAANAAIPESSVYSATKAALDSATRVLAAELGPRNIRVNSIAPGAIVTEGFEAAGLKDTDFEKGAIAQTPLGRIGQPEDVAKVAVFLASDTSGWISGERLQTAGGYR